MLKIEYAKSVSPQNFALLFCVFVMCAPKLWAQYSTPVLYVVHAQTIEPLPEASVQTANRQFAATTNENAFLALPVIPR
jgi:hypothetical protein